MGTTLALGVFLGAANLGQGAGAPSGYGFLRIGNTGSSQLVRVGASGSAPRILIKTGA